VECHILEAVRALPMFGIGIPTMQNRKRSSPMGRTERPRCQSHRYIGPQNPISDPAPLWRKITYWAAANMAEERGRVRIESNIFTS